ncbi:polysaccharide deacetylase family protein [Streptomyces ferrugineus]|uniref:Polysaccharide deacetylase family protein n=1 Tax=Streptomyces ferrugineus TaxID=1413221 RepID=A0A7M2SKM2_9ACTN|nr:polysaccharide deacetylase family protein [Streptomyces ferrugineus]QOV36920.1 polysaccharide deacetylase family protein [Streptomyces ferrugineus]
MVRSGGRGWFGKVLAAALGVVAVAVLAAFWNGQFGSTKGQHAQSGKSTPPAKAPAQPQGGRKSAPVSADIAHASDGGARSVNITIDDGPDPTWTPQILQVLRDNGVKATFCMVGPQARAHPDLVKAVVAAGHRLCDHTVSHDVTMDGKPEAYQSQQILDAERMITEASGGVRPLYYRAPGGAFTPYSRHLAASHGMRPLGWNIDSKDFERAGTNAIVTTVKDEISNGPTLLFHDGGGDRSQTVAALREILPWLKEQGHTFGFPVR